MNKIIISNRANVIPLFKKDDKSNVYNCRPVLLNSQSIFLQKIYQGIEFAENIVIFFTEFNKDFYTEASCASQHLSQRNTKEQTEQV